MTDSCALQREFAIAGSGKNHRPKACLTDATIAWGSELTFTVTPPSGSSKSWNWLSSKPLFMKPLFQPGHDGSVPTFQVDQLHVIFGPNQFVPVCLFKGGASNYTVPAT